MGAQPLPSAPVALASSAQRRIPSSSFPSKTWLPDGAFLSTTLFSLQLPFTQKEGKGGERERGREEGEGRGRTGERELSVVWGRKHIHKAAMTSPTQAEPNPCCPLVNEPISFWLPVGAKQPQGNSCVEAKL